MTQHGGEQNDHQHIRQRINDIHNAHDDQIDLAADVTGDTAHEDADYQHDDACKKADSQRDTRAVNNADEIIAPGGVCTEQVREHLFAGVDLCLLCASVMHRRKIVIRRIHGTARGDAEHLLVAVGPEDRDQDGREGNDNDDDETHQRDLVFHKSLHTVAKKGRGRTHLHHISLFVRARRNKIIQLDLQRKRILFHCSPLLNQI